MKKRLIVILMLVIMLASINVNALSTSIGALIYGKETKSTYGHVMSYRKTSSEDLNRNQYFLISGINQYQKSLNFITQDPNDNIQSFKKDTLEISLEYNDNNVKLEDIRAIGKLDFKFYVSQDYINYVDVSDAVVYDNDSHTYHYNGDLKAYKVEFINKTNGTVDDKIYVEINHQIKLDYSNMNEDQKAGKQKLNNWLDTKNANQPPISNGQNIFNIQPIIKGEIKYQRLENDNIPTWLSAINKANIPLNLYEK
ncbi:MAG: hypothetical protein RR425_06590, partial [Erysipelotrichales bacterium]